MFEDTFMVSEDGSANGCVHHRMLLHSTPAHGFERSVDAHGVCHAKHADAYRILPVPDGFAVAGQDVYGSTSKSIVVADGHGPNGTDMALRAVSIASAVDEHDFGCIQDPKVVETELRNTVKSILIDAPNGRSGATYVQMLFHQWRRKRWIITVNIGDSEALIVRSNSITQCAMAHNWDNKDVYKRYMSTCTTTPQPVCYNRWNAGKHKMTGPGGSRDPVMLYNARGEPVWENAEFISNKLARRNYPFGTQSLRMPTYAYENWGSCVCVGKKALGQLVVSYGDQGERFQTGASYDMIHVYVHELSPCEDVVALVQSDGVSNHKTLQDCGLHCSWSAEKYLGAISKCRDDMSVVKCRWGPRKNFPCPAS